MFVHFSRLPLRHAMPDGYVATFATGWLELYCLYIGKFPIFSRYTAEFLTELYESCIMNIIPLAHVFMII